MAGFESHFFIFLRKMGNFPFTNNQADEKPSNGDILTKSVTKLWYFSKQWHGWYKHSYHYLGFQYCHHCCWLASTLQCLAHAAALLLLGYNTSTRICGLLFFSLFLPATKKKNEPSKETRPYCHVWHGGDYHKVTTNIEQPFEASSYEKSGHVISPWASYRKNSCSLDFQVNLSRSMNRWVHERWGSEGALGN